MWTALFIIAVAAAICFGVAAIILQFGNKDRDVTQTGPGEPTAKILLRSLPALGAQKPILLNNRMKSLHLDPDEFARFEPVMIQELSIRCRACESTAQCASDLARNANEAVGRDWRDYCPNAATLNMLSVVRDCHAAFTNSEGAVTSSDRGQAPPSF